MTTGTAATSNRTMTGMIASARADLLRIRKWPATWVISGTWLLLTALFGYVFNYVSYRSGDSNFASEGATADRLLESVLPVSVPEVLVAGTPMFGGALLMVLGAMVAGSGYAWGTWKTVLTQGPSRTATTLGSLLAVTLVVVLVVIGTLALCLVASTGLAVVEDQPVVLPTTGDLLQGVGTALLVLETWALLGFALGTAARGPALAVGLGLVWALVVENLLRGVGALLNWMEAFTTVLPGTAAGSLVGALLGPGEGAPGVQDVLSADRAAWTLAAYVVLLPLVTLALVRRRDLA